MKKEILLNKVDYKVLKGIAHRGFHNEIYTENGMNAFKNALENDLAFELDIHLTKDKELVVCHDSSLKRTTSKEGIIEDLTLKEIRENYKLLDGGDIPTLKEVIEFIDERVPIIIELKVWNRNYKELAIHTCELIEKLVKDKTKYMFISFDPRALYRVKKTNIATGLLVCKAKEWTYMFRHLFDSVDLEYSMIEEKRVKKYYKNHFINVWTIQNKEVVSNIKDYVDTMTFQHLDKELISESLKK